MSHCNKKHERRKNKTFLQNKILIFRNFKKRNNQLRRYLDENTLLLFNKYFGENSLKVLTGKNTSGEIHETF